MIESRWIRGRVTVAPEARVTRSGDPVTNFTIAENNAKRDPDTGEWTGSQVMYWDCECWDELAQAVLRVSKGAEIVVRGNPRTFKTSDGRYRTRVRVEKVYTPLEVAAGVVSSGSCDDEQPPF